MDKIKHRNWDLIVDSPGRINIIGEHTDYNNGFVLPTAIDKKVRFKLRLNNDPVLCRVYSNNFETGFSFNLHEVAISKNSWENYILGVIYEINQLTDKLKGFDCELSGNIPIGSGISSSAALECGLAFGLNELFELDLDKLTIVKLSQRAEHNFVGTKCGIMDQFASVMSKQGQLILLDCENLEYELVPFQIGQYSLLLLNTNVIHDLSTGEYNIRRQQCEKGVEIIRQVYPDVNSLRDVSIQLISEFQDKMDEVIYKRCKYVIEENNRVLKSVQALKKNDLPQLGEYLYASHDGLKNMYEVSCPELDFLVDLTRGNNDIPGARLMGGGFGGCTINLIRKDAVDGFINDAAAAYKNNFGIELAAYKALPDRGTRIVSLEGSR